tara:strand:+ start:229 stop:1155 length:927 start_codon:yes stop_codon:yes gene_type:complete
MNENINESFEPNEISVAKIFGELWANKKLIITSVFLFSVASVIYSLSLTNLYTSNSTVSIATEAEGRDISQYQGLAAIAGINLPSSEKDDKSKLAMTKLKSREFFEVLYNKNGFLEDLMGAKSFDFETRSIVYDVKIFDVDKKKWVRDVSFPLQQKPSLLEAHKYFHDEVFKASEDLDTGFITISIEHLSPEFSQKTLEFIIKNINDLSKSNDLEESLVAMKYLENELAKTDILNISDSINQLIEFHTYRMMKAQTSEYYLLKVIDKPHLPERKSSPNRAMICILGFILGFLISSIYIIVRKNFNYED